MSRLRASRSTHAGASVTTTSHSPMLGINTKYQQEPNIAVGAFADGELQAFICGYGQPEFWVLDLMVSSGTPADLHQCLDQCLMYYEDRGVFCFYYAFPQKWARAYRSFWRSSIPRLQKYVISDVQVIEPRKKVADPWIWEHIMHQTVVKVPLLLRKSDAKSTRS